MGAPDRRLSNHGQLDFRLRALYRSWATADDPPSRVKPLPIGLLTNTVHLASVEATPAALAAADCLIVGFYFLLRPGEYLGVPTPADNLFRLKDLHLWIGSRALDLATCPIADLRAATFATLTFTRQKNGVRNERIGHGRSGHPTLCPVLALAARACALQSSLAPDHPLSAFASAPRSPQFVLPRPHSPPSLGPRYLPRSRLHARRCLRPVYPRRRRPGSLMRRRPERPYQNGRPLALRRALPVPPRSGATSYDWPLYLHASRGLLPPRSRLIPTRVAPLPPPFPAFGLWALRATYTGVATMH
ncbi:hypothetical protein MHU86_12682 [Fragilaria crotonensis]|nr:hypothetical protein MHU86_12682 [Fragilaria crotonensis]